MRESNGDEVNGRDDTSSHLVISGLDCRRYCKHEDYHMHRKSVFPRSIPGHGQNLVQECKVLS